MNPSPPALAPGRLALVTGASSGLGLAFARALAARGMNVALTARSGDRLEALAAGLRAAHGVASHALPGDLAVAGEPERIWRAADALDGGVHLLVNNAGFGLRGRFEALPLDAQNRMVQLNSVALMELAHLAVRAMGGRGGGAVVNVASVTAFQPGPRNAVYAASKAFVLSLSEALAEECRGSGVRVLTLSPGPTPTGFQAVAGNRVAPDQPGALPPEQVVAAALRALSAGKRRAVPGLANRAAAAVGRRLPLGVATRLAARMAARTERREESSAG